MESKPPCHVAQAEVVEPTPMPVRNIVQKPAEVRIKEKRCKIVETLYDAKLEDVGQLTLEAKALDLERFSRVAARLDNTKEVKIDANITAMGIFALFPVATDDLP